MGRCLQKGMFRIGSLARARPSSRFGTVVLRFNYPRVHRNFTASRAAREPREQQRISERSDLPVAPRPQDAHRYGVFSNTSQPNIHQLNILQLNIQQRARHMGRRSPS